MGAPGRVLPGERPRHRGPCSRPPRTQGVRRFVYTSTPAVVYNGRDLAGGNETLPLTTRCPSHYPLTKAVAEREVRQANSPGLRTVALRPHLILGEGDPHLLPRVLARARAGRLHIVGTGRNRVDLLHVENAADAHLLAERALLEVQTPISKSQLPNSKPETVPRMSGAGRTSSPTASRSSCGNGSTSCCAASACRLRSVTFPWPRPPRPACFASGSGACFRCAGTRR